MAYGVRDELTKTRTKIYATNKDGNITSEFVNVFSPVTRLGQWQFINPVPVKGSRFIPGQYRVNPVVIRKFSASCAKIDFQIPYITSWGEGYLFEGDLSANLATMLGGISGTITGSIDSMAGQRCQVRCYSNLSSPTSDIGVLLAEAGETLKMIANPLSAVRSQLVKLWKRSLGHSRKTAKRLSGKEFLTNISNQWLEYRYGILPAMSDAKMLMDLFSYKVAKAVSDPIRRVSSSENSDPIRKEQIITFYPTAYLTGTAVTKTDTTLKTVCTLYYRDTVHQPRLGLSITDIPNLAWELVPFSFCVDWVLGVGDWLRSHYIPPGLQPLGCSVSYKERILSITTPLSVKHNWYSKIYRMPYTPYIQKRDTLVREHWTSPPALPPVSRTIMNFNRTLDSLSLSWKPISDGFRKLR